MNMRLFVMTVLCSMILSSCRKPEPASPSALLDPAQVDAQNAYREVENFVATGPRELGTAGAQKAAFYLVGRLSALGIEASLDIFTNDTPNGPVVFRNVVGRIPGKSKGLILLASHYDAKGGIGENFQGANDSGSSTGLLLELARLVRSSADVNPEIRFVFFDGEECIKSYGPHDGLYGSRHYAENLVLNREAAAVQAVIVVDMIGDKDLSVTMPHNCVSFLLTSVLNAAREEGVRTKFSLHPYDVIDDHEPFLERGMPAIDIIDFHYGSAPGLNDYWHTTNDTMDKISAESLGIIGRVVIRTVNDVLRDAPKIRVVR